MKHKYRDVIETHRLLEGLLDLSAKVFGCAPIHQITGNSPKSNYTIAQ